MPLLCRNGVIVFKVISFHSCFSDTYLVQWLAQQLRHAFHAEIARENATEVCQYVRSATGQCLRIIRDPHSTAYIRYSLGRRCQYEGRVRSRDAAEQSVVAPTTANGAELPKLKPQPPSAASPFYSAQFLQSNISIAVTENLSCVVGDLFALRKVAGRYFSSIHVWFPILSESSYDERLSRAFSKPCAEFSLLSLSLALITTIPPEDDVWDSFSSLYMLVKSSIAVVEAANIYSLEVVQARLLVSLFEVGHDIEPAAYISIAATARAAAAIGLNKGNEMSEEGSRVWWGIVMLDR